MADCLDYVQNDSTGKWCGERFSHTPGERLSRIKGITTLPRCVDCSCVACKKDIVEGLLEELYRHTHCDKTIHYG
jgi:hypothetical protein